MKSFFEIQALSSVSGLVIKLGLWLWPSRGDGLWYRTLLADGGGVGGVGLLLGCYGIHSCWCGRRGGAAVDIVRVGLESAGERLWRSTTR